MSVQLTDTCMESGTICKVLLFFMNCNLLRFKQDTYSVYAQVLNPVTYLLQTGDQTRILTPFLSLSKYSNNMATKVDNVNSAHCKIQSIPCNIYIQLFSCDLYFVILFYFLQLHWANLNMQGSWQQINKKLSYC